MTAPGSLDLIDKLEFSFRHLEAACDGLSDVEGLRKPAPDRWSVIDCIEHVCITENFALKRMQAAETAPDAQSDPAREAAFAAQVGNRDAKLQGPAIVEPVGRHATLAEALAEFAATRGRTIEFVRSCPDPAALRLNHPVFGPLSGREYVIVIAGHSVRHAAQIGEIRAQLG